MEKRFVLFMVLAVAIMVAYTGLQSVFGPKREAPPVAKKEDGKGKEEKEKEKKAEGKKEDEPQDPPDAKPDEEPAPQPEEDPDAAEEADQSTRAEQQWLTLGSLDTASPYRMLVTFNSRGAAVERIELSPPLYRDLDTDDGYLGHLALTGSRGQGAVVNVVGRGTPAAEAVAESDSKIIGLAPGDVIQSINDAPIKFPGDVAAALDQTKPEDSIRIGVERNGAKLTFVAPLRRQPLSVIRPEIEQRGDKMVQHPLSLLTSVVGTRNLAGNQVDPAQDPLRVLPWEGKTVKHQGADAVEFRFRLNQRQATAHGLPGPVELVKRYRVARAETDAEHDNRESPLYHLVYDIEIHNLHDEPLEVAYQQDGPNGLPTEGWWYTNKISTSWGGAGARDIAWRVHDRKRLLRTASQVYKYATKNPETPYESLLGSDETTWLDYVGVDAQYFSVVLIPNPEFDTPDAATFRKAMTLPLDDVETVDGNSVKKVNTTFRLTSDFKRIEPGASYKQSMQVYAGPKDPPILYHYDLQDVPEYGWFRVVSIPLSWLLHFLHDNIFFNYGLAIVALTVIVRACMFPFSRKAAKNAQLMQQISPELKAIAEKYKNDLPKRSEAQSALFKKYNYHPLSGCLPMFLQLPIFLGLYRSLAVDIELRQAPLIPGLDWASNLSAPDMFWYWEPYLPDFIADPAHGWLGPYLNILPLVSVALLLVHQKLFTPPATDEQTQMTQSMMKYMTLMMGLFFFKVPAGLCIYFITSSLWSIGERVMLPNVKPPPGTPAKVESKPAPAPKSGGNGASDKARHKKQKRR